MMEAIKQQNGMWFPRNPFFDLDKTLDCGQCFRWQRDARGVWSGIVGDRLVEITPTAEGILIQGDRADDVGFWETYFDSKQDYQGMETVYEGWNPWIDGALDYGRGIRILNQPFWETLITFVLSANNNIPRIRGLVEGLSRKAGDPVGDRWGFPTAEQLARLDENALRALGMGYRAPYVLQLAQGYADGRWNEKKWEVLPSEAVRKELVKLPGVGPKVANCVLLFGLGRRDVFPVDTWMKKALSVIDQDNEGKALLKQLENPQWNQWAGYLQQVIFYRARTEKWEG